eukprot:CAMPEP_0176378692 /NCGR_PEP_ID=MMETSP0126-20121128/29809_1 /TAXON_ID=141414 ORGANISM="Strombidinopsis acuminatum, Strain SPMC142" /NCGR_SAMPLE_ID=MMETSP0126 /ASSEMBLY_ACC=CAM_ASM_000229 /LENGTH=177 /DNA_ID=CAMNT_0017741117 /DNA_START=20 /DNA_END=553 /DNA_ORIENTATION=+
MFNKSSFLARNFSTAMLNYRAAGNPQVFLRVAQGENVLGDLVFELYEDKVPGLAENFATLAEEKLQGNSFHSGMAGLGISAGRFGEENHSAFDMRLPDEDLQLRHHKRGLISMTNNGEHTNGSEFMITFNEARFLDGYQVICGELVEGDAVLAKLEEACNRHGEVNGDVRIVDSGSK